MGGGARHTADETVDVPLGFGNADAVLVGGFHLRESLCSPRGRRREAADALPEHGFPEIGGLPWANRG